MFTPLVCPANITFLVQRKTSAHPSLLISRNPESYMYVCISDDLVSFPRHNALSVDGAGGMREIFLSNFSCISCAICLCSYPPQKSKDCHRVRLVSLEHEVCPLLAVTSVT